MSNVLLQEITTANAVSDQLSSQCLSPLYQDARSASALVNFKEAVTSDRRSTDLGILERQTTLFVGHIKALRDSGRQNFDKVPNGPFVEFGGRTHIGMIHK